VRFPTLAWDASLFGVTVLAEFVEAQIGGNLWRAYTAPSVPPPPPPPLVNAELDELHTLVEYRAEVLSEAVSQSVDMIGFWAGLLMFSPNSHPWTFRLARTAIVVGEFAAMHYKHLWNRPRPSQLSPGLMPPLAVPGHASYPSGHSTQAYLVSMLLAQVMPAEVSNVLPRTPTSLLTTPPDSLLDRLAERVARNREVLGLHYPSDSVCGQNLAVRLYNLLQQCPLINNPINGATVLARAEW
jgi:hypothetical protein